MKYFLNSIAQSNGDHEVHANICSYLPKVENRIELGEFINCTLAVEYAKKKYPAYKSGGTIKINGCIHCCKPCHTS